MKSVLAQLIGLPLTYEEKLRAFVALGGKLIVEGLSLYHDGSGRCRFMDGFSLADLMGGV